MNPLFWKVPDLSNKEGYSCIGCLNLALGLVKSWLTVYHCWEVWRHIKILLTYLHHTFTDSVGWRGAENKHFPGMISTSLTVLVSRTNSLTHRWSKALGSQGSHLRNANGQDPWREQITKGLKIIEESTCWILKYGVMGLFFFPLSFTRGVPVIQGC